MAKKRDGFEHPHEISEAQRAFPANVVGTLMPPATAIPDTYEDQGLWQGFFTDLFFRGSGTAFENWRLYTRDDVDGEKAWVHLTTILRSYEPKHEHKEAAFAWLASRWFAGIDNISDEAFSDD